MSGGRIFLIIVSVFILLIGLGLVAGGGALWWSNAFLRDSEGYYTTRTIDIERNSYGVTTYPARIEFGPTWFFDWSNLVKVKLSATNNRVKKSFIGIAEEKDLLDYLSGVAYDEIVELHINQPFGSPRISYREYPGEAPSKPPTEKDFWVASTVGSGTQVLRWGLEEGRYSLLLMNHDASRGLDITGKIGVKVPMLKGIGIGLVVAGFVFILFAFALVYLVVTRSQS
ncbi:MAG: hypothetical protein ABEJ25_06210 [Candidatus Bipolaricaulia bacterium]